MIELNFRSTDPDEISLAQYYWAMNEDGKFEKDVVDLLPFRDISTTNQLVALIRQIAQARDKNQICPNCGGFEEVTSRSHAKKSAHVMRYNCSSCRDEAEAKEREAVAQAQKELTEHLQVVINRNAAMTIDYGALPDDIVLLLLALNRATTPRLLNGTFMLGDCRALAPAYVTDFIRKLYKAGAIVDQPEMAKSAAYFVENGILYHYNNQVVYRLTPDENFGGGEQGFNYLEQIELQDNQAIRNLWLEFATADCMSGPANLQ